MNIPQRDTMIATDDIIGDSNYKGMRILRYSTNEEQREKLNQRKYLFQYDNSLALTKATLCRKGMVGDSDNYRLVAIINPNLKDFTKLVMYDPCNPPPDNYEALLMKSAHDRTQADFKGAKNKNKDDFRNYMFQAVNGETTAYLPVISGWQTTATFHETIFVAYDEDDADALYGDLFLPKSPIMQADGQTQTASLFGLANSKEAIEKGALEKFRVTMEIELNVGEIEAGQSFADRNGRGTNKNKSLIYGLDNSSPLSKLEMLTTKDTVFEGRIAKGRGGNASLTATQNIVELSTMMQMLLEAIADGTLKPEHIRHYHIDHFKLYAKEFINLIDGAFSKDWVEKPAGNQDPFRKLYVHGWPFALKGIAKAYYRARLDKLAPIVRAIKRQQDEPNGLINEEEDFLNILEEELSMSKDEPPITLEELNKRLGLINWLRYKKHWISITGASTKTKPNGAVGFKTFTLKETGEEKVVALAQNSAAFIALVRNKILAESWIELCQEEDEPLV
jgi:hypothetical protein